MIKNKKKVLLYTSLILGIGFFMIAADHIDAPDVAGGTSDITDFYAFQGENTENLVFVASVKGLMSPTQTADANFSENTLVEFNIDTDGDFVEDKIIQATRKGSKMYFFGPFDASETGLMSSIQTSATQSSVSITNFPEAAVTNTENGLTMFAGPRDDPFFMDFGQFQAIVSGQASSFNNPGDDTFAGTNVLSIVVEVPKSMICSGCETINTWVESKDKQ